MIFLIVSGIVALVFGFLLLVTPGRLKKLDAKLNMLTGGFDNLIFKYRQGIGICLLVSAIMMFFVAYYLRKAY